MTKSRGKIKLSAVGLTVKTRRFSAKESYPGDTTVQVQTLNDRGRILEVFNIRPITIRGMRWWENDRYGAGLKRTITDWKKWALDKALNDRGRYNL